MSGISADPKTITGHQVPLTWGIRNGPGILWAVAIATVATVSSRWVPLIGAPVLAIMLGAAVRATLHPGDRATPGLGFASKYVLQAAIVLLGAGIGLTQVAHTGTASLPVMLGTLVAALLGAFVIGRLLGVEAELRTLVGVGTGICGASAIAAVSPVIDAKRSQVAYAITAIFAFNVVGVISFPLLGHLFGLGQESFGLWSGTAINDTSSVVAAAAAYGHIATDHAVIVKLTRTTLIVPIVIILVALRARRHRVSGIHVRIRQLVPWFIVLFLVAAAVNTTGVVTQMAHHAISHTSVFLITVALAAIGLSVDAVALRRTGLRPLLLGALVWFIVAGTSLGLQAATGQL
jgi:uncharacterized integral membrane protein (TIGR00698 family)